MASQKIADKIQAHAAASNGKPFISFEFFPPKTEEGVSNLMGRMPTFKHQQPLFVDMTWGAGGSTSDLTLALCTRMQKEFELEANMHLTCTNMEAAKVDSALKGCREAGIRNIVALRGDPPAGQAAWTAVEGGFACALDLVKHIRKEHGDFFGISVAGYPEGHPNVIKKVEDVSKLSEAEKSRLVQTEEGPMVCSDADFEAELAYLKQKVDAGADLIITQMFFDVDVHVRFVAACRRVGINCPIVPGIMCITAYGGFKRMTAFAKTRVPASLADRVEALKDDAEGFRQFGEEFGAELCKALVDAGVPGLHFYTLNLSKCTFAIMQRLGYLRE